MPLMSTVKPPLTLPLIAPRTTSLFSKAPSSIFQVSARRAFSRDSRVSPLPSSTASIATYTSSPILRWNSPLSSRNWLRGITPSDFSPACTVTHSLSMSMTMPVMMEPDVHLDGLQALFKKLRKILGHWNILQRTCRSYGLALAPAGSGSK